MPRPGRLRVRKARAPAADPPLYSMREIARTAAASVLLVAMGRLGTLARLAAGSAVAVVATAVMTEARSSSSSASLTL